LERIARDVGSVSNVLPLAERIDVDAFLDRFGDDDVEAAEVEMDRQIDEADTRARGEGEEDGTLALIRGESFEIADLEAVNQALEASRGFVPEFDDVRQFLEVYLRAEGGTMEPIEGDPDVVSMVVPPHLRAEVGTERIARATFRRDLAVQEVD